nr:hypothetical protein [Desulfobacteraceae bacterium]
MKKRVFWKGLMAGSVAGWLFVFWGCFFPFHGGMMRILWWGVMLGWTILHPLELAVSIPIGKQKGLMPQHILV